MFVALDLILFFLFFDLSIVFMYFVIAGWGHGERARAAALKFFLYTFLGLAGAAARASSCCTSPPTPHTFDIVDARRREPARGRRPAGRRSRCSRSVSASR